MSGLPDTVRQAFNVTGPTQSNTAGVGVCYLAATTTAANTAVPAVLYDEYVYLRAEGDKIFVGFGGAADIDLDKTFAGGSTFATGTQANAGIVLSDGEVRHMRLNKAENSYIRWQSKTANAVLIIQPLRVHASRRPRT